MEPQRKRKSRPASWRRRRLSSGSTSWQRRIGSTKAPRRRCAACTATDDAASLPATPALPTNGSRTLPADLDGDDEDYETRSAAFQRFRRELLEAEARPCYA